MAAEPPPCDPSTPAVVLKFHRGTVGIVRSLGRLGVAVYGVDGDGSSPALRSTYLRATLALDAEGGPPEVTVARLNQLGREIGRSAVLIPTSDKTAAFVAEQAEGLKERFLFASPGPDLVRRLIDKREMCLLAEAHGVPLPRTCFPRAVGEALDFARATGFPLVLKGILGNLPRAPHGQRMAVVAGAAELEAQLERSFDPAQPNVMVQELIVGRGSGYIFNGYFDRQGRCLGSMVGRKLRQYPVATGPASLGECSHAPELDALARGFLAAVGYRGIVDLDWCRDRRDGRFKVLDVNPRIGSTFRLFVDRRGIDVARLAYRDLTGQPPSPLVPNPGRRWLVEDSDPWAFAHHRRRGEMSLSGWLRSWRRVEELAWFATDDPLPFLHMCRNSGAELLGLRRGRRPRPPADEAPWRW